MLILPVLISARKIWILRAMLLGLCIALLGVVALRPARPALVVVSSTPPLKVSSVVCTSGTNHVYYYGGTLDRLLDPFITRLRDTNASRLRCSTAENSAVVWVRFVHPAFGALAMGPPAHFRAQLVETNNAVTPLEAVETVCQHFRTKSLIMGWVIQGQLEARRGSTIRIDSTNGLGSVLLRVPQTR